MTGSTHKTFPGPQRGVILGNMDAEDEKKYWPAADRGVFPGSSSNHHLNTLPALLVATREMKKYGRDYAAQIIRNAQALGRSLDELGTPVEAREFGYTQSHMIAVNVSAWGGGVEVAKRLEDNDIIVNYNMVPGDTDPRNPSGLRIGVPEMTRFGMDERAMGELAQLMHDGIRGKNVKERCIPFVCVTRNEVCIIWTDPTRDYKWHPYTIYNPASDPNGVRVPFIIPRWAPYRRCCYIVVFELRNEEGMMPRNLFVESLLHSRKRYWRRGLAFMMLFAMSVSFFTFSCSPPAQGAQVVASTSTSSAATPTHTVTWDRYSLKLDGKRLMVWSGEFHYWRLPSPALWSDVLQKIKAAGFNTISIYFDWAYHSPKAGVYDFTGIRDVSKLLTIAQDAGLYVIARPGPYINAETDAGGFPGWLITQKRTSAFECVRLYRLHIWSG